VVEDNRDFLLSLINQYVDIVFANEDEAKALTQKEPEAALADIAEMAKDSCSQIREKRLHDQDK
jgi:sugar/nucleoside kinase (ribokinase family)